MYYRFMEAMLVLLVNMSYCQQVSLSVFLSLCPSVGPFSDAYFQFFFR